MRAPVTNTVRDPEKTVQFVPAPTGNNGTQLKCFNCNESAHIRSKCPKPRKDNSNGQRAKPKPAFKCTMQDTSDRPVVQDTAEARMAKCAISGTLEGRPVNIQLDSPCSQSAVTASLVSPDLYIPGKTVTLHGINGEFTFPIALMSLDCMLVSGKVELTVIDGLPMDVLLGHDLDSICGDILKRELFVLTRAQARKEIDDFVQAEQNLFELQGELTYLFSG